jgi:predicted HicB family RNase H-like nuclease
VAKTIEGNTMKNILTYKGYTARIEFDQRDNIFTGKIIGITENITFHGKTVKELRDVFQAADQ